MTETRYDAKRWLKVTCIGDDGTLAVNELVDSESADDMSWMKAMANVFGSRMHVRPGSVAVLESAGNFSVARVDAVHCPLVYGPGSKAFLYPHGPCDVSVTTTDKLDGRAGTRPLAPARMYIRNSGE